ncbi:MAG: glycosyltransferase family 4 protein, partial [Pseudomonadota bacterium]
PGVSSDVESHVLECPTCSEARPNPAEPLQTTAFPQFPWDAQSPDAKLIVAGMKPSQRVLDLRKRGNIDVTGFVEEMLPYYHEADIFIAPFQIARGVQNKILQAFACGLPVVTTPIGAEGIDGVNEEHFLVAESPGHFAAQIQRLVEQPELYQRLSTAALKLINEEYLWEAKNRQLIDLVFSGAPD